MAHDHHHDHLDGVALHSRRWLLRALASAMAWVAGIPYSKAHLGDETARLRTAVAITESFSHVMPREVSLILDANEASIGPHYGGKLVARAWVDPAFKALLLQDATCAIAEFPEITPTDYQLVCVEQSQDMHNLVYCRPCSCYPVEVLGPVPSWYKSAEYRALIADPRAILAQFGTTLPASTLVEIRDSDYRRRYMALPRRPSGTDGYSETQLAALVTRDAMIGTTVL